MKGKLSTLYLIWGTLAILLILSALFVSGYATAKDVPGAGAGVGAGAGTGPEFGDEFPFGPEGAPTGSVFGKDVPGAGAGVGVRVGAGKGAGTDVNYGFDWVYVVASALVLAALGFGVAVGYGTRKQLLQQ
jgi:hypothetical protein